MNYLKTRVGPRKGLKLDKPPTKKTKRFCCKIQNVQERRKDINPAHGHKKRDKKPTPTLQNGPKVKIVF